MDYQVIWTELALADLEAIIRRLANDDLTAAEKLRLELLGSVEILGRCRVTAQLIVEPRRIEA